MSLDLTPLIWFAFTLPILLLLQRWIHTHLHGLSLLLMGKPQRAVVLYAIVLLPGVILHELSHWLAATFLGVRTGAFSVLPRTQADGTVQLGYVEYYKGRSLGPIRESLIGGAPLLSGTAVILAISLRVFGVPSLTQAIQSGNIDELAIAFGELVNINDFFVWLYLLFAISNAMMPSRSDRRAWPAFLLVMAVVAIALYALGIQRVIFASLANAAALVFSHLGLAFTMAISVDLLFMLVIAALEGVIGRFKGVNVVYGRPASSVRKGKRSR
ncbi:MAG: hypothetical protein ACE5E7_11930 [Anaerolineae bacterium]